MIFKPNPSFGNRFTFSIDLTISTAKKDAAGIYFIIH